jgi:hypothetical protein
MRVFVAVGALSPKLGLCVQVVISAVLVEQSNTQPHSLLQTWPDCDERARQIVAKPDVGSRLQLFGSSRRETQLVY